MPPRVRVVGIVRITSKGSYGVCECGYRTNIYAYPENAYAELATHMLETHMTLDFNIVVEYGE